MSSSILLSAKSILGTWFDELGEASWFAPSAAVDDLIRARFSRLYEEMTADAEALDLWLFNPDTSLAAVILLDQMPRNMFRGTARSFASDRLALKLSTHAIARGHDLETEVARRGFYYLPFEHSERLEDQDLAVRYFRERADVGESLRYAEIHREIIQKFGRFPHRNSILGRMSTAEEIAYLENGGHDFGATARTSRS